MKVVLLAPGKSSHTHKWALFFKEKGLDVYVLTFKDHYSHENAQKVKTLVLPKLLPGKLSYLSCIPQIRRLLKEIKPDILHAHFVSSYGFVGAISGYHPLFISVWGTDIYQFPKRNIINRLIIKYSFRKADVICSTSNIMAKETNLYTNKKINVTPFGVNLSIFYPGEKKKRRHLKIGIVKGLEDVYGFLDLFKAFIQLKKSFSDLELDIVGDGSKHTEYMEICKNYGIEKSVNFIGRVPNEQVPRYIRDMDVVVLPSLDESFGVSAIEAMACGVPVVVSDADGFREVVRHMETGIIVPKRDPEKLATAITKLLKDESLRETLGSNGVAHVRRHYDWEQNARQMLQLYEEAIESM